MPIATTAYGLLSRPITNLYNAVVPNSKSDNSAEKCKDEPNLEAGESNTEDVKPQPKRIDSMETDESCSDNLSSKQGRRTKTTYSLAHPPPLTVHKKITYRRPKVLLQLHKVSCARRQPDVEVLPANKVPSRLAKIAQQMLPSKDKFGPDDILFIKSNAADTESGDIVGGIFVTPIEDKNVCRTEVVMHGALTWEASMKCKGVYEFTSTDKHGLQQKARWIARPTKMTRRRSLPASGKPVTAAEEKKFIFSTISPGSRRHPVIGNLCQSSIQIFDEYTIPCAAPGRPSTANSDNEGHSPTTPSPSKTTDDSLRNLMLLTASWVAFRENWSPAFQYNPNQRDVSPAPSRTPSNVSNNRGAHSPALGHDDSERSTPRISRSNSVNFHRRTSSSPPIIAICPPTPKYGEVHITSEFVDVESLKHSSPSNTPKEHTPPSTPSASPEPIKPAHSRSFSSVPPTLPEEPLPEEPQDERPSPRAYADPLSTAGIWDSGAQTKPSRFTTSLKRRQSVNAGNTNTSQPPKAHSGRRIRKMFSFLGSKDKQIPIQA